jgi:hypothetical protein
MSKNKFSSGCLPVFLIWLILVVIRYFSVGKPWEDNIVNLMSAVYWIGIVYMIFAAIVNKANELPKPNSNLDTRGSSILKAEDFSDKRLWKLVNENVQTIKPKRDLGDEASKKYIPLKSSHEYRVTTDIDFIIKIKGHVYSYFAIFQYFPVNRYQSGDLNFEDLNNRGILFDFKDGRNVKYSANLFASALINNFGRESLMKKTLIIIPAASKEKTEIRFKEFCNLLSEYTNMDNGYEYLVNIKNREAAHNGGSRNYNPEEFLQLKGNLFGKDVLVIDDVRTSGRSSDNIYNFLNKQNPKSITFCYMARTVN